MKVGLVNEEVSTGDLAQGVISFELLHDQLDDCPIVVEPLQVERLQGEIGDQNLIVVPAQLEQRELLVGVFRLGSPLDHEPGWARPTHGLVAELASLDAPPKRR
jgi:hypothetical protein